ncbi:MAG TPA: hypothetical protein VFP05_15395 [Thermomicrobiales bacterium]|nr:hypothetical protein [Thermomicrobiales bacterium]
MTHTHHHGNHRREEAAERREEEAERRAELRKRFQERLAQGGYDGLIDGPVQTVIEEAAAIQGIDQELGAVRFALAKVLNDVEDANQLASSVARLAACTAQLLRVVRPTARESEGELIATLNQMMVDLEKEARAARAAGRPAPSIVAPKKPYLTRFK